MLTGTIGVRATWKEDLEIGDIVIVLGKPYYYEVVYEEAFCRIILQHQDDEIVLGDIDPEEEKKILTFIGNKETHSKYIDKSIGELGENAQLTFF